MKDGCRTSIMVTVTFSDLTRRSSQASHNHYTWRNWILVHFWFRNTTAQPLQDHHKSENDFIWSSQHWNSSLQASHNLYSCGNWDLGHSWYCKTSVQPPRQWKQHYLIFPALKHESTTIMALKHTCTTSTGPPRQCKRFHLTFQAMKQESTSTVQPLPLLKVNFSIFLVLKHTCTTYAGQP